MKKWWPVIVPGVLLVALLSILRVRPDATVWAGLPFLLRMGYLTLALAAATGLAFGQTRAVFIAAWLALGAALAQRALAEPEPRTIRLVWLLLSLTTPMATAINYRLRERGMLSANGVWRVALTLAAGVMLVGLLRVDALTNAVERSANVLLRPVSAAVPIPLLSLIALLACLPAHLIAMPRESRQLGPLLLWATIFHVAALAAAAGDCPETYRQSVFFCLHAGGALALALAVMESAWRHAHLDKLTELANRRAFTNRLGRLDGAFAIALVDIDHFKKINDQYGHDTGDQVLRYIATHILRVRGVSAYRYGGEEFAVILDGRTMDEAADILEPLRATIESARFHVRGRGRPKTPPGRRKRAPEKAEVSGRWSKPIGVTVSIGLAEANDTLSTPQQVIKAADQALYRAKNAGRNRLATTKG